jgi:ATP-dependent DNA ligase
VDLGILIYNKMKDSTIAASFMRAAVHNPAKFGHSISMPKLNGLRCMFIPGRGFFSRDGKRWNDAVLAHIVPPTTDYIIDGELYCHGMSLQQINSAVGVNRIEPGDNAQWIVFFAFDLVEPKFNALTRMLLLDKVYSDNFKKIESSRVVPWEICKTRIELDRCYENYVDTNYEGQMIKSVFGSYMPQGAKERATMNLQKRKAFLDAEFSCVGRVISQEGKCAGKLGALKFVTPKGVAFEVGTGFTDEEREEFIREDFDFRRKATIKYLNLTDDGLPFNASFVGWREDV